MRRSVSKYTARMISAATSRAPILGRPRLDRPLVELARAAALERDQTRGPARVIAAGREILDRAAGGGEILERQVDAAARRDRP